MHEELPSNTRPTLLLTASEAAARLGVKKDTVYAYVSRGLLRRREVTGTNESLYDPAEVEALAARARKAAPQAVAPVFRSALTTIANGEPYFRGLPACRLAVEGRFEDVVRLLWQGHFEAGAETLFPPRRAEPALAAIGAQIGKDALPLERMRCLVPFVAAEDPLRHDHGHEQVMGKAAHLMVRLLCAMEELSAPVDESIAALVWSRLSPKAATPGLLRALDATLVLAADHDLGAPSTAAVRLAAAVRADIYAVVTVGLNSGGGVVQSASTLSIENDLSELNVQDNVGRFVGDQLRHGREMRGFGHRAYPDGDPRARLILDLLRQCGEAADDVARLDEIVDIQLRRGREPPNIGFAIAAVVHCAGMRRGAGELIFNYARMAGWVAHAMEEYDAPTSLPRLKSIYVGPNPTRAAG